MVFTPVSQAAEVSVQEGDLQSAVLQMRAAPHTAGVSQIGCLSSEEHLGAGDRSGAEQGLKSGGSGTH